MKRRPRPPEQAGLPRLRLVGLIDPRHELVELAALIDLEVFEREWAGFFPSHSGRPATEPRLVAGRLYPQQAYRLSDEAVVARWVGNPYCQYFTGETFFRHRLPIKPSSLTRWHKRIAEDGVEWMLSQMVQTGRKSGVIDEGGVKRVAVDTTVMEKSLDRLKFYNGMRQRREKCARLTLLYFLLSLCVFCLQALPLHVST